MNKIIGILWGGNWINNENKENVIDDKIIAQMQRLFNNKMPLDLIRFYKKYGQLKSENLICPMDLSLNLNPNASIGLVDELNSFFGGEYFQKNEENKIINEEYKCVGKMWLGDDTEEIHCLYYNIKKSKYGRLFHHQDNGQDIDSFGLKYLLNQNKKFETMEDLISNEINHATYSYLASTYECYAGKDLQPHLESIVQIGLFDSIISYIYELDLQPWSGVDKKISKIMNMFSIKEIAHLNKEFKTLGWSLIETENQDYTSVKFIGEHMNDIVFNSKNLESLNQILKNIDFKEKNLDLSVKLNDINEFYCICK